MAIINAKPRTLSTIGFNNLMDGFFTGFPSVFREDLLTNGYKPSVPANVFKTEQGYEVELVAPGFEKEDFEIRIEKNLLTVKLEKEKQQQENRKSIRKEYGFVSFSRSFTIPENVDADNISAKYVNGVLTLNLPGKAEVKEQTKTIAIQ